MKDVLGDRMKDQYESRSRTALLRRCYTIIRVDGKAFHSYCRGLKRPFDDGLMEDMDQMAAYLCKNIMGAKCAFIQSDEVSILMTDFEEKATQSWFDNDIQKVCSISAAMATRSFNEARLARLGTEGMKWAEFDSRVFQIADREEVMNYFIWRQQDTTRNSISSVALSLYSHKELHAVNSDQKQELIFRKGINWNDLASRYKRGRMVVKEVYEKTPEQGDKNTSSTRSRWVVTEVPIFTQQREFLLNLVPLLAIREKKEEPESIA